MTLSGSFFFNDTAPAELYTLSLHDALPISMRRAFTQVKNGRPRPVLVEIPRDVLGEDVPEPLQYRRSEEHTSELQSHSDLVCRLLLEKKKKHSRKKTITAVTVARLTAASIL